METVTAHEFAALRAETTTEVFTFGTAHPRSFEVLEHTMRTRAAFGCRVLTTTEVVAGFTLVVLLCVPPRGMTRREKGLL